MTQQHDVVPVAAQVIAKVGGITRVARIVGRTPITVAKWRWSKSKGGTGGLIPTEAAQALIAAARRGEIDLSADDFFPPQAE